MLRSLARGTAYIAVTQLNCTYVTVGVRNAGLNLEKIAHYIASKGFGDSTRYKTVRSIDDAKQFTGLSDSQCRSSQRLDFHFNPSLIALNVAKYEAYNCQLSPAPFVFSMTCYKRREFNRHLLLLTS